MLRKCEAYDIFSFAMHTDVRHIFVFHLLQIFAELFMTSRVKPISLFFRKLRCLLTFLMYRYVNYHGCHLLHLERFGIP